jgi:hypothetical protein
MLVEKKSISILVTVIILFSFSGIFAQKDFTNKNIPKKKSDDRKFIYGKLSGRVSYSGYFWFDNTLSQMGQRIIYKENLSIEKGKILYAHDFETFTSDSIFLRSFKTIPIGTGRIMAMIPRIVSGKIELYNAVYAGFYSFKESDHFHLYDGIKNIRAIRRKFKEQMKELLNDDPEILQWIDREELTYDDLPTIIYNYNLRRQK